MDNINYFSGRKKYGRPQAMLWADNPGTLQVKNEGTSEEESFYLPYGFEVGAENLNISDKTLANQFLILSDDNRSSIDFSINRIEKRERMINGRSRSYHIADKISVSSNWDMLPSRSHLSYPDFDTDTGKSPVRGDNNREFTTDGGAGGVEMLKWYQDHPGSFWVYLSYDKYSSFGSTASAYSNLNKYSQVVEVFFEDFSYSVVKRGASNYDFWNVSISLEEV